ncbi:MAG TPA: translation initiation factor IF-2 N-terminal domain-containing protein, partial [Phycisphaerales bacterium]|nr:translation initiation factor IF-2 N-terminal domain-containing protein [Phycisphaerales bacterium]
MAQKRIFEIAKELNVESKLIIQKCWDEGISKDVVKNHMSAVTIGLAESIKEWFHAGGSQVATAVETAAKIDQAAEAAHE